MQPARLPFEMGGQAVIHRVQAAPTRHGIHLPARGNGLG